jgi:outer membrane protein TolC
MPKTNCQTTVFTLVVWCTITMTMALKAWSDEPIGQDRQWWEDASQRPILPAANWVSFDLNAVVLEAIAHNPRIAMVNHQAAIAMERIVQEDAVFDPNLLLESKYGSTSDPVGNSLTTGGPPRLHEDSWDNRAGVVKRARDGTSVDLSQQMGLLDSNSLFFQPTNQGNTRLNLSVTKPLRSGSGRLYNERLLIQARIDSRVTSQQLRQEVQGRIALTMMTYWRLYEARCHLLQQRDLLARGIEIEKMLLARRGFDSGELEVVRVANRIARRRDDLLAVERDLKNLQTELSALVPSPALRSGQNIEMIPLGAPQCVPMEVDTRDAVITAISLRPEVRSAAIDLESAALELSVTRNELLPQLNAVVGGYLAGLNGENDVTRSFGDQFADGRPGVNAGITYELPYAQRAARSRHRAAHQRLQELNAAYRESVVKTTAEVEIASRNLSVAIERLTTRQNVWETALKQESLVKCRWETVGPEGRHAALVLEDLLNQQETRTNAEKELVAAQLDYILSLIELQQAMGTLLTAEGTASLSAELLGAGNDTAAPVIPQPRPESPSTPEPILEARPESALEPQTLPLPEGMIETE